MGLQNETQTRTKRLNLRATPRQEQLIKLAAARQGLSVTDFILEGACEKAETALAGQTRLVLGEREWKMFMAALDRPPRAIPEITRLFSKPPVAKSR
jgi:uncharacterized protein (DUF1778 family)